MRRPTLIHTSAVAAPCLMRLAAECRGGACCGAAPVVTVCYDLLSYLRLLHKGCSLILCIKSVWLGWRSLAARSALAVAGVRGVAPVGAYFTFFNGSEAT